MIKQKSLVLNLVTSAVLLGTVVLLNNSCNNKTNKTDTGSVSQEKRQTIISVDSFLADGNPNVLRALLYSGIDGKSLLFKAAAEGRRTAVESLITEGIDINSTNQDGKTALVLAAESNHSEIVRYLINHDAFVNRHPVLKHPLVEACKADYIETVRALLEAKPSNFESKSWINDTSLHLQDAINAAISSENPELFKLLIQKEYGGSKYLYIDHLAAACRHRQLEIIKILIDHGIDVNGEISYSRSGETPLFDTYDADVAELLLANGAKVNYADRDGSTPLINASDGGNVELVKVLIKAGARVNAKDEDGFTPLMAASQAGNIEVVKVLLEAGADVNAKDNEGQTAFSLAEDEEIKSLLRRSRVKNIGRLL